MSKHARSPFVGLQISEYVVLQLARIDPRITAGLAAVRRCLFCGSSIELACFDSSRHGRRCCCCGRGTGRTRATAGPRPQQRQESLRRQGSVGELSNAVPGIGAAGVTVSSSSRAPAGRQQAGRQRDTAGSEASDPSHVESSCSARRHSTSMLLCF